MSASKNPLRLGVNLDHVATLRNARGENHPALRRAVEVALKAGVDGVTLHLREDRRHIVDADIEELAPLLAEAVTPLNLEIAATEEMLGLARAVRPPWVCLVPEKRAELTTEGGLDLQNAQESFLATCCASLAEAGVQVSLFVDPSLPALEAAAELKVPAVEVHTGPWCNAVRLCGLDSAEAQAKWQEIVIAGAACDKLGLGFHAGHGLRYDTAQKIAGLANLREVNIGQFIVGEAVFVGLDTAIAQMREALNRGRAEGR